jgi:hypothetical protein
MSAKKRPQVSRRKRKQLRQQAQLRNETLFRELLDWFVPEGELFAKDKFHGNIQWSAEQLACQALIWSWQETKNVTDAFEQTQEVCEDLGLEKITKSYTSFMNALDRYGDVFATRLRQRTQSLAEEVGGRLFRTDGWVLLGFDGSRATAPRTVSNEQAFCAPNYGHGKRAKYGKKKSQGLRRQRNQQHPSQPQAPQAWITLIWHMGLRLPWTWRLGPSNASERHHVQQMLAEEKFPKNTLFCGDAGFVGYPLWSAILDADGAFVVRVGGNVKLLSEQADVKRLGGGIVLCWPKGKMESGQKPLLTSVLDPKKLSVQQLVRIYQLRWGVEVEFRGLKQTIDKHTLRCRNSDRLLVELDWSLRGMAVAELVALREQIASAGQKAQGKEYDPKDRSLANTLRALRKCMRNLSKLCDPQDSLLQRLSRAVVQRYVNRTDKRSRYRRKNPDKKPLGDPVVRKMNAHEREMLKKHPHDTAV